MASSGWFVVVLCLSRLALHNCCCCNTSLLIIVVATHHQRQGPPIVVSASVRTETSFVALVLPKTFRLVVWWCPSVGWLLCCACARSRSYAGGSRNIFGCCCTTVYVHHCAGGSRDIFGCCCTTVYVHRYAGSSRKLFGCCCTCTKFSLRQFVALGP